MSLLAIENLSVAYGDLYAVRDVSFAVEQGTVFVLLGANGAGKTSILRAISGLLRPRAGRVLANGNDLSGMKPHDVATNGISHVPEGRRVFPNLTVEDNLVVHSYAGVAPALVLERAFDRFPVLARRRGQLAGTLSGGEQQMLSLARALGTAPAVLLLDELSMGLAPLIVERLFEEVHAIAAEGIAVLVVEQFANVVLSFAQRVAIMATGELVFDGTPGDAAPILEDLYLGRT